MNYFQWENASHINAYSISNMAELEGEGEGEVISPQTPILVPGFIVI